MSCTTRVEDPVSETQKSINKNIPITLEKLWGTWIADSTYTLRDTRSTKLDIQNIRIVLYADQRFRTQSKKPELLPDLSAGVFELKGDSISLIPDRPVGAPRGYLTRLSFMGNYLRLYEPKQQRYTFYHRLAPLDTLDWPDSLSAGIWVQYAKRDSADSTTLFPVRNAFQFLIFSPDSLKQETWIRGLPNLVMGKKRHLGDTLVWELKGEVKRYLMETPRNDTLRLWPIGSKGLDSGFSVYYRTRKPPTLFKDLRSLLGYWRGDSLLLGGIYKQHHYGYFRDLIFYESGRVSTLSSDTTLPKFINWTYDSGYVVVEIEGKNSVPLRYLPKIDTSSSILKLSLDGSPNQKTSLRLDFFLSQRDSVLVKRDPIQRFDDKPFVLLGVRLGNVESGNTFADSLKYFYNGNWNSGSPEAFEVARINKDTVDWAAFRIPQSATFTSGQSGFFFRLQGTVSGLRRFRCRDTTSLPLTIRLSASSTSALAEGTLQGNCKIDSGQVASVTDSILTLEGRFRIKRQRLGSLQAQGWYEK